ncbi:hypothetical protein ACJMK2_018726 [Sinanodonta woodiana]|uniref:Uncharacterized protein n=1 Tax=Sinanodonta woodiana TaxID=1069815 RepID=A0ABD3UEJ0_SINWO
MSRQFPEHYCSVSEQLSHILDNVGYSREDRFRKVTIVNETEVFFNMATTIQGFHKVYSFGSRSEGSTGPDLQSDTDRMFQFNIMKVVNDISQCPPELNNMLMVHDDHTHPGYVNCN